MLQGAITMPSTRKEPDEIAAACSSQECTTSASSSTSRADNSVSRWMVARAQRDSTRCVSTSGHCCSRRSSSMPSTAPVAPVMPTTIRLIQLTSHHYSISCFALDGSSKPFDGILRQTGAVCRYPSRQRCALLLSLGCQCSHRASEHGHELVGIAQPGGEMERGHQSWDQHRRQGQHQYRDWKEHRFTYISFV